MTGSRTAGVVFILNLFRELHSSEVVNYLVGRINSGHRRIHPPLGLQELLKTAAIIRRASNNSVTVWRLHHLNDQRSERGINESHARWQTDFP